MDDFFQDGSTANFSQSSAPIGIDADLELDRVVFRDSGEEDTLINAEDLVGSENNDRINGSFEDNTIDGGNGNDFISGASGNDDIRGGNNNDFLIGGLGNDRSEGGDGNDLLAANGGDDVLSGGAGSDRFLYSGSNNVNSIDGLEAFGTDRITDFERGVDRLELRGFRASFEELNFDSNNDGVLDSNDSSITANGSGLTLDFSNEFDGSRNVIILDNVTSLEAGDIAYVS